jgi:hypothetical protein
LILSKEWVTRIPLFQKHSPAELAASIVDKALSIAGSDTYDFVVVDFCSGAGGPIPTIESLVNKRQTQAGNRPIKFLMTDIKPHILSWEILSRENASLGYVSEPVDATNPPAPVISGRCHGLKSDVEGENPRRVFYLYCLAFHHFDDDMARKVIRSTLHSADGFAILELQDRRVASFILMGLHFMLVLFTSIFWFWTDPLHLALTYLLPVLPTIMAFDGAVSSLRTREFEELIALIHNVSTEKAHDETKTENKKANKVRKTARLGPWTFEGGRETHTIPFGFMNWFVGYKYG